MPSVINDYTNQNYLLPPGRMTVIKITKIGEVEEQKKFTSTPNGNVNQHSLENRILKTELLYHLVLLLAWPLYPKGMLLANQRNAQQPRYGTSLCSHESMSG